MYRMTVKYSNRTYTIFVGNLVTDYLLGKAGTTEDYCANLTATGDQYNLYNLLMGDFRYIIVSIAYILHFEYFSVPYAKMTYYTNQKNGSVVNISPGKIGTCVSACEPLLYNTEVFSCPYGKLLLVYRNIGRTFAVTYCRNIVY